MTYSMIMLTAVLVMIAQSAQRTRMARAEAMRRHPAGRGR